MTASCRFCSQSLKESFVDLGMSPLSNSYLRASQLNLKENFFPLHARVCHECYLVQLEEFESPREIFSDYAYFSSYSESWLAHAKRYTESMIERFHLGGNSKVVEIASNDGYLLQYFQRRGVPALGIEPAQNVAKVAIEKGIETEGLFFGHETAVTLNAKGHAADLLLGNNVLAHVPDLNSFVRGLKILLKPQGVITMEFPHLLQLMQHNQFDTIYHEHFSYFSLLTVEKVFAHHGLTLFDVEELSTHGGSLRIYARHMDDQSQSVRSAIGDLRDKERAFGLNKMQTYQDFSNQVAATKRRLLTFLIEAKNQGKTVVGYGAPAKGNTLLNYCGVRNDFIDFTVDRNPHKQGMFLPGTHIPIENPEKIHSTRPDYVLILPWNLREEIVKQCSFIREWGGKFVVPIPQIEIF